MEPVDAAPAPRSRLWRWFVAAFSVQPAAWGGWLTVAAHHPVRGGWLTVGLESAWWEVAGRYEPIVRRRAARGLRHSLQG